MAFSIYVPGVPRPQGSKGAVVRPRKGRMPLVIRGQRYYRLSDLTAYLKDSSRNLAAWRNKIRVVAQGEKRARGNPLLTGAAYIEMTFSLPRPKSHCGTGRNAGVLKARAPKHHVQKPDRDKLERAVCDALTGIVWVDDCQVVAGPTHKVWCDDGRPGVTISVRSLEGEWLM